MQVFEYYSVYCEYFMNILYFLNFFILLLTEKGLDNIIELVYERTDIDEFS